MWVVIATTLIVFAYVLYVLGYDSIRKLSDDTYKVTSSTGHITNKDLKVVSKEVTYLGEISVKKLRTSRLQVTRTDLAILFLIRNEVLGVYCKATRNGKRRYHRIPAEYIYRLEGNRVFAQYMRSTTKCYFKYNSY